MRLEAHNITAGYGNDFRIEDIGVVFEERGITGIVGPNGAGKSTFLRVLNRSLKPEKGVVLLGGRNLHKMAGRDVAKRLAFVGQRVEGLLDLSVEELVYRGRFPHQTLFGRDAKADREAVEWALEAMRLRRLRGRHIKHLSSGELQRTWTAMALAQQPDIMLMDEPTSFLDIAHQFELMDLLHELTRHGVTIVMSMHDLSMTSLYCQNIVAMRGGRIVASGPVDEVLTVALIRDVFDVDAEVRDHEATQRRVPFPYRLSEERKTARAIETEDDGGPDIAAARLEDVEEDEASPH